METNKKSVKSIVWSFFKCYSDSIIIIPVEVMSKKKNMSKSSFLVLFRSETFFKGLINFSNIISTKTVNIKTENQTKALPAWKPKQKNKKKLKILTRTIWYQTDVPPKSTWKSV